MSSDAESDVYDPSYRQKSVDTTLDQHERRISRLEKVALITVGYGIAEGSQIVTDISGLFV